jgi:hypothetical protein
MSKMTPFPAPETSMQTGRIKKHRSASPCISNIKFIAHAFAGIAADEIPWVTGFPGDPYTVDHRLWGGRGCLPLPWFIRPNYNNYLAVSTFKQGVDGKHHRRKDNFGHMHLGMVDDVGTKVSFDKLVLPPSAMVETSPDNYQVWYFLNPPEADRLRAERLIDGMVANGLTADASDPGMKGVTRYGRLPVGVNGKAKYVEKLGGPFVQRVAIWTPQLSYSVDQIAEAYGVDMTLHANRAIRRRPSRRMPQKGTATTTDGVTDLMTTIGLYLEPIDSIAGAHRVVCPWVHEHTDEDPSGTVYFEPSEENADRGGFKCHHGHCQHRNIADLVHFLARLQQITKD